MPIPTQLQDMANKVAEQRSAVSTVRELLSWFGAYRRSWRNIKRIRSALDEMDLFTSPDFEGEYIDNPVSFARKQAKVVATGEPTDNPQTAAANTQHESSKIADNNGQAMIPLADPAHRISRLVSAKRELIWIQPDATVEQAVTWMLRYDYSQLPVMQSNRDVKGLISWKSLGSRLVTGKICDFVRVCMDKHQEISSEASLFDAVKIIAEYDCVLVRAADKTVCGIVTASDISSQFHQLAEPFLLLGDIENHLRYLISKAFSVAELQQVRDPGDQNREIQDASDLTVGEYVRLLQNEANWTKLGMKIDRGSFTDWLDKIRIIRNDIMHFDPDPIEPADLRLLTEFSHLLIRYQQLSS